MSVHVRGFRDQDYPRFAEINNLSYPDALQSVEEIRYGDATWDYARYARVRVMAETAGGLVIGSGRINHIPDEFHPLKYSMHLAVDPAFRRRGAGGVLYTHLVAALQARGAIAARAGVQNETDTESIGFLVRRGFVEIQRGWRSGLQVPSFDFSKFSGAEERAARQRITITTLAAEQTRDPDVLRKVFELVTICEQDAPSAYPVTEMPFGLFVAYAVDSPNALPDAFFLAKDGARYVGVSAMQRPLAQPGVLHQQLTALLREYRSRGIAMALKLKTVRYAREHGYREIRTWNHAQNQAMLRINDAMGFVKQPAWVSFEKALTPPEEA